MSVEYTAKGQGYYRVYVNGEERSKHLTEREALENATNYLCEYRDNEQEIPECIVKHDYEVDVTINAADITMQVGDGGVLEHISTEWPDATNTGVQSGITLTPSGSVTTSSDGQLIENLDITGTITVNHDNVIIRNCRLSCGWATWGIWAYTVTGTLIEYCEVTNTSEAAMAVTGSEVAYCHIHTHRGDGIKVHNNDEIHHCYITGLFEYLGSHNDGIQAVSGSNINIHDNRIDGPYQAQTSAILMETSSGAIDNITFNHNYLYGGNYTLYMINLGNGDPTNISFTNNVWDLNSWQYGPVSLDPVPANWVWTNNTYSDESVFAQPW